MSQDFSSSAFPFTYAGIFENFHRISFLQFRMFTRY